MSVEKINSLHGKCALVTGAARRIGAAIARKLHDQGVDIALHYRGSADEANALRLALNEKRAESAQVFQADISAWQSPYPPRTRGR